MRLPKSDTRLHFVGIGGIGMSGLAEVFHNQGYRVSGSDLSESDTVRRLQQLGVDVALGHHAQSVHGKNVVVVSSAVRPDNPEVREARRLRIPVIPRAEMLGELMRGKTGIAIAGTHGKTTTTSMVASILTEAALDPTIVIGGKVDALGGNAKLGSGECVVAEADESDGSFLHLPATFAVVTNIDNDHLDHYGDLSKVEDAFVDFVGKLPFYGVAAVCAEDPGVRRCLERLTKPVQTYGFSSECDLYADSVVPEGRGSRFRVWYREAPGGAHRELGWVVLHVPGSHNVLNALGAISVCLRLGVPVPVIAGGLDKFRGVRRRFDVRWEDQASRRMIVDDYGHHPAEVAATLAAARKIWPGRILAVFQPHRYSRTQHCREAFLSAFREADRLWITEIYSAGEDPIPGVTGEALARDVAAAMPAGREARFLPDFHQIRDAVLDEFRDGDMILCMGAGTITRLPEQLLFGLSARK